MFSLANVCFTINEAVAVVVVPFLPGLGLTNKTQAKIFAGGFVSWRYSSSVLFYHYTRTMVQLLWQCDGDGLFLKVIRYRALPSLLMQLFGPNQRLQCYSQCFSQILVGLHGSPRYSHGFSWFIVGFHGFSRYFHDFSFFKFC